MGSSQKGIIEDPSGWRAYQGNPRCAVVAGVWQSRRPKESGSGTKIPERMPEPFALDLLWESRGEYAAFFRRRH